MIFFLKTPQIFKKFFICNQTRVKILENNFKKSHNFPINLVFIYVNLINHLNQMQLTN